MASRLWQTGGPGIILIIMPDEFDEAALDFARFCLKQPQSYLSESWRVIEVRPDGYNTGPESFSDNRSLQFDNVGEVLPLLAYWCRLNTIRLEIGYFSEIYSCRFTEGDPVYQIVETTGSANLCHELLAGAAHLARQMKSVEEPHASMRWSDFIAGRDQNG
jgi:hypothetical protein